MLSGGVGPSDNKRRRRLFADDGGQKQRMHGKRKNARMSGAIARVLQTDRHTIRCSCEVAGRVSMAADFSGVLKFRREGWHRAAS